MGLAKAGTKIGITEDTPFFVVDGIAKFAASVAASIEIVNAKPITAHCRARKSASEIALMQRAKNMTLEVHKAAASILHEGITTTEVAAFIHEAHKKVGASGSYFCIVLFGPATAFPHGVKDPQTLKTGDMVLIDTGCQVEGYISDITRTYVFGEPTVRQRMVWNAEKAAQAAALAAAQLGVPCREVDIAARRSLAADGFGPQYELPGLPHRTGHGIGLDIHEWPYLVGSDTTPLAEGMCFSNEPMICVPGEFGIRLEDHFYMTADGPRWFTEPSHSVDDPFGLEVGA
jgi:Xaa-Pro dipeptidase